MAVAPPSGRKATGRRYDVNDDAAYEYDGDDGDDANGGVDVIAMKVAKTTNMKALMMEIITTMMNNLMISW